MRAAMATDTRVGLALKTRLTFVLQSLYTRVVAKKLIAVRFKEKQLKELAVIAKREDEPLSETIRRAVAKFLEWDKVGKTSP